VGANLVGIVKGGHISKILRNPCPRMSKQWKSSGELSGG